MGLGYEILGSTDGFNARRFIRVLHNGEPVALFLSWQDAEDYIASKRNKNKAK